MAALEKWAGAAIGAVVGLGAGAAFGMMPIGGLAGGALGAVVDMLRAKPATTTATMHGEWHAPPQVPRAAFGFESLFGMDVNMDDTEGVVAGDIGCAAPARTLRG
jgi:hypothetical protein